MKKLLSILFLFAFVASATSQVHLVKKEQIEELNSSDLADMPSTITPDFVLQANPTGTGYVLVPATVDTDFMSEDKTGTAVRAHTTNSNFSISNSRDNTMFDIGDGIGIADGINDGALFQRENTGTSEYLGVGDMSFLNPNATNSILGISGDVGTGDLSGFLGYKEEMTIFSLTANHSSNINLRPNGTEPSVGGSIQNNANNEQLGWFAIDGATKKYSNIFYGDVSNGSIEDVSRIEASNLGSTMFWRYDLINDKDVELTLNTTGLTYKDTDNGDLLIIDNLGEVFLSNYKANRDDTATDAVTSVYYPNATGEMRVAPLSAIAPQYQKEQYILAVGQTVIPLTGTPTANDVGTDMWINGVRYEEGTHYTISGNTVTLLFNTVAANSQFIIRFL